MELCTGHEEIDSKDHLQDVRFQLVTLQRKCVACFDSEEASQSENVILNCVFNTN